MRDSTPEEDAMVDSKAEVQPCPDGDNCPDARKYGKVHPKPQPEAWDRLALTRAVINECIVRAYTRRGKKTDLRDLDPNDVLRDVTKEAPPETPAPPMDNPPDHYPAREPKPQPEDTEGQIIDERDEMEERVNQIALALGLSEQEREWSSANDPGARCIEKATALLAAPEPQPGAREVAERIAKILRGDWCDWEASEEKLATEAIERVVSPLVARASPVSLSNIIRYGSPTQSDLARRIKKLETERDMREQHQRELTALCSKKEARAEAAEAERDDYREQTNTWAQAAEGWEKRHDEVVVERDALRESAAAMKDGAKNTKQP